MRAWYSLIAASDAPWLIRPAIQASLAFKFCGFSAKTRRLASSSISKSPKW